MGRPHSRPQCSHAVVSMRAQAMSDATCVGHCGIVATLKRAALRLRRAMPCCRTAAVLSRTARASVAGVLWTCFVKGQGEGIPRVRTLYSRVKVKLGGIQRPPNNQSKFARWPWNGVSAFRFFSIYVDLVCNKYPTYLPTYLPTYSHLTKLNSASRPRPRKPTYLPFASYRADLRRSRKNETLGTGFVHKFSRCAIKACSHRNMGDGVAPCVHERPDDPGGRLFPPSHTQRALRLPGGGRSG